MRLRRLLPRLAIVAVVPLLMAPPEIPCRACGPIARFRERLVDTTLWREVELQAGRPYRVSVQDIEGASALELVPLDTTLRTQRCAPAAGRWVCDVVVDQDGVVGVHVEPIGDAAEVAVEVTRR